MYTYTLLFTIVAFYFFFFFFFFFFFGEQTSNILWVCIMVYGICKIIVKIKHLPISSFCRRRPYSTSEYLFTPMSFYQFVFTRISTLSTFENIQNTLNQAASIRSKCKSNTMKDSFIWRS